MVAGLRNKALDRLRTRSFSLTLYIWALSSAAVRRRYQEGMCRVSGRSSSGPRAERSAFVVPTRPREVVRAQAELRERPKAVEPTRSAAEVAAARLDDRIEAAHAGRIAEAKGETGFIGQVKEFAGKVVTQVIERAAFVLANHIAPGIGGHIVNLAVEFKNAINTIENLSRNGTIELQIPVVTGADGTFGLWAGPTISQNEKGETALGVKVGPAVGIYEHVEVGKPDIEVTAPEEARNESASVPPEIKIVEHSESITSEMKLWKHEVIDQPAESVTRHSDPIFTGSDLQSDYSLQRKPPGRQLFIEPTGVSLEWIKSEEKAAGSLPSGSTEHGVDDNASPGRPRAKHAPSISEIPQTAIEGYSTRSLTDSSPVFGTGSETHIKGGSSGGFTAGARGGTAGGSTSGGRVSASKVTGVVVWGSAAAIAAWGNSPILSHMSCCNTLRSACSPTSMMVLRYQWRGKGKQFAI